MTIANIESQYDQVFAAIFAVSEDNESYEFFRKDSESFLNDSKYITCEWVNGIPYVTVSIPYNYYKDCDEESLDVVHREVIGEMYDAGFSRESIMTTFKNLVFARMGIDDIDGMIYSKI